MRQCCVCISEQLVNGKCEKKSPVCPGGQLLTPDACVPDKVDCSKTPKDPQCQIICSNPRTTGGSSSSSSTCPPPPPLVCKSDEHLVDGKCVPKRPLTVEDCKQNEVLLADNKCHPIHIDCPEKQGFRLVAVVHGECKYEPISQDKMRSRLPSRERCLYKEYCNQCEEKSNNYS